MMKSYGGGFVQTGHDARDGDLSVIDAAAELEIAVSAAYAQATIGVNDAAGNQLIVTNLANVDTDHALALQTDPFLGVAADDLSGIVGLLHDKTSGVLRSTAGYLALDPANGTTRVLGSDDDICHIFVGAPTRSEMWQQALNGGVGFVLASDSTMGVASSGQTVFAVRGATPSGRQLILCDYVSRAKNYDHDTQTDPTLFIHSATDPDTDNTQWGSLAFSATNDLFAIGTGSGTIRLGSNLGAFVDFLGGTAARPQLRLFASSVQSLALASHATFAQNVLAVADQGGNQLVFANTVGETVDAGHATTTNPTLFIHSDLDPSGAGAAQWGSFAHDQTDFIIDAGLGDVATAVGFRTDAERRVHRVAVTAVAGAPTPDVYTVLATDYLIGVDSTNDTVNVQLEAAATAGAGRIIVVKDEGGAAGGSAIGILPDGVETIDGAASVSMSTAYQVTRLYCTGSAWFTF